jgi:N-acetylglutamate synthase-like GNAT family acetyltransferase
MRRGHDTAARRAGERAALEPVRIATGTPAASDLPSINAAVEGAVMTWPLPERVKRLVLPIYRYSEADRRHLDFAVARAGAGNHVLGVAAWEPADPRDCPAGRRGLLLHGLYVSPAQQRRGIGKRLLQCALGASAAAGFDGLLVRAQRNAEGWFEQKGFERLPVGDARDYAGRYWQPTDRAPLQD